MKRNKKKQLVSLSQVILLVVTLVMLAIPTAVLADEHTVGLGTASTFGILAGSTITNTGPTTLNGTAGSDIGLHPGDDPTLETFPGQEDVTYGGTVHLFNDEAEQAKIDLLAAYNNAAGRTSDETIAADLEGRTLSPGVYTSASSISITGQLTLDGGGDPNAVFIFQAGSTLTTAPNSEILLIGGAQPCNVFWQVGSSATLDVGSRFVGHIMAMESITANTNAIILGQLLAITGAVTLQSNTITNDACVTAGSLRVTKEVTGDINESTPSAFEITLNGPNQFSDTQTIKAGESYTWTNLVAGAYEVTENDLGSDWNVSGVGEYNVQNGEMTSVTVTNEYVLAEDKDTDFEKLPDTGGGVTMLTYSGLVMFGLGIFILRKWKKV
jgi:LPXTG-motif cell wall-anchored protein